MSDFPTIPRGNLPGGAALAAGEKLLSKAKSLQGQDVKKEKELEKAVGGFEALMLHQMLSAMWETVDTSGLMGEDTQQAQIFRDMLNQAIAEEASSGRGVGLKGFLKAELLKRYDASKL